MKKIAKYKEQFSCICTWMYGKILFKISLTLKALFCPIRLLAKMIKDKILLFFCRLVTLITKSAPACRTLVIVWNLQLKKIQCHEK